MGMFPYGVWPMRKKRLGCSFNFMICRFMISTLLHL